MCIRDSGKPVTARERKPNDPEPEIRWTHTKPAQAGESAITVPRMAWKHAGGIGCSHGIVTVMERRMR